MSPKRDRLINAFREAIVATGDEEAQELRLALKDWSDSFPRTRSAVKQRAPLLGEIFEAVEDALAMLEDWKRMDSANAALELREIASAAAVSALGADDVASLLKVADLLEREGPDAAHEVATRLDTIVRELIPVSACRLMGWRVSQ